MLPRSCSAAYVAERLGGRGHVLVVGGLMQQSAEW